MNKKTESAVMTKAINPVIERIRRTLLSFISIL